MKSRPSLSRRAGYALAALALGVLAAGGAHAQSISSVSGDISHGSSVTISGSGFGTKPTAAPIIYDDFENVTPGNVISTAAGWTEVGMGGVQQPRYDNALRHAGNNSMKLFWDDWNYACSVKKRANFSQEFYVDGWFQYDQEDGPPWSRVVKLMLMFGNSSIEYPQIHIGTANCTQDEGFHVAGYANASQPTDNEYIFSLGDLIGSFNHIQIWMRASDSGQHNGSVRVWFNGQLIASSDSYMTVAGNEGVWDHIRIGYFHAHDGIPGMCGDSPGDAFGWWDNLYLDNTQARVELGDAPSYDACNYRETQVPTSWSPTAVTVNLKQGKFQAGQTAYLFVVNANGAKSPGRQVTIGGGGGTEGPGQPGKPVF